MLHDKINHAHVCGGNARCSTCRVSVIEGLSNCLPRNEKEKKLAQKLGFPQDVRLACQTRITGDITIRRLVVDDMDREIILTQLEDTSGTKLGQEKNLAILFTDIENYTRFAEAFPAYDVVHVLNRYYQTMNDIIIQHKGIISDVAGDGILALFGVIEASKNPVMDAINTVIDMNTDLIRFNKHLNQMYHHSFGIRAGIHFGKVVVGNFDTGRMSKISAIGDAVNLASRIENANKEFGTKLLISQEAFQKAKGVVEARQMYRTALKGKSGKYVLYEIVI
jgi:adenylate cyclase